MGVLDGKVAIVTGAGNGIGREHALLFAREGARVVVNDPGGDRHGAGGSGADAERVVAEIRAAGGKAVASLEPVGKPAAAAAIVATAVECLRRRRHPGQQRRHPARSHAAQDFGERLGRGARRAPQGHLHHDAGGGAAHGRSEARRPHHQHVVGSGLLGNFGQSNYGAAKAAIWGVTRIAAIELARHSITVNAIAPIARTRMTEDLPGYRDQDPDENTAAQGPQHIAPLVAFLASDQAAGITGEVFGVGGTRIFLYKMMCTRGIEKRGSNVPWTQEELLGSIDRIMRI